jgi:hypothetical protein
MPIHKQRFLIDEIAGRGHESSGILEPPIAIILFD